MRFYFSYMYACLLYLFVYLQLTLTDVVEPPDYEDFVIQNQCLVERDPFRDLLLYPEDDIEVQKIPKPCRTLSELTPEPGYAYSSCFISFVICY